LSGRLTIVATPIGNLGDLSDRSRLALERATLVACEDTRHTGKLLAGLGFKKKLLSLHEHNERSRLSGLIERLEAGEEIALVSDAGTPLLSDPGYLLVRAAAENKVSIEAVPGPSAVLAALVLSALPPHPFTFAGFPPPKSGKRKTFFERFASLGHTVILFESPHRLLASLEDARAVFGPDRPASVSRELTKLHEETLRGPLGELVEQLGTRKPRGEYAIVIGGA
jgi:16S rRNA (cytidine1402-2'-O)-methyltransferase